MKPNKSQKIRSQGGLSVADKFLETFPKGEFFYEDVVAYFRLAKAEFDKPSQSEISVRALARINGLRLVNRETDGSLKAEEVNDFIRQAETCALTYDMLSFAAIHFSANRAFANNPLGQWWLSTERLDHERPTKYPSLATTARFKIIAAAYVNLNGPYFTTSLRMREPDHGKQTTVADAIAVAWGMSRSNVHTALYAKRNEFLSQGIEFDVFKKKGEN